MADWLFGPHGTPSGANAMVRRSMNVQTLDARGDARPDVEVVDSGEVSGEQLWCASETLDHSPA